MDRSGSWPASATWRSYARCARVYQRRGWSSTRAIGHCSRRTRSEREFRGGQRSACISEVLDDVALYLADRAGDPPANLEGYLVRAVRNRYLKIKRAAIRREQHYGEAVAFDGDAEHVIRELCSEDALRASAGPGADVAAHSSHALRHLAALLGAQLSAEEMQMLGWVGAGVPRRQIAEWLGLGYDAARKRIYRASRRLYALMPTALDGMSAAERAEAERFLRRIGLGERRPERSQMIDERDAAARSAAVRSEAEVFGEVIGRELVSDPEHLVWEDERFLEWLAVEARARTA